MTQTHGNATESASPFPTRLATEADVDRLIELVNSAFAVETFLEGTRTDEGRLRAMMTKGSILIAEEAGQFAGCVYAESRGRRGYLGQLAVAPARQGTGLSRRILAAAEEHLRSLGCEAVDIAVLSQRAELVPIYRRLGYAETGTGEFVSTQPLKQGAECHLILMSKRLAE
jgi:N-acetylglutamate synthase-like GNAT family acetyltransferase